MMHLNKSGAYQTLNETPYSVAPKFNSKKGKFEVYIPVKERIDTGPKEDSPYGCWAPLFALVEIVKMAWFKYRNPINRSDVTEF
jgi:hypothetical protein